MRILRGRRTRIGIEALERRNLLTTLVALIDTGVDLQNDDGSAIDPYAQSRGVNAADYYDLTDGYDAYSGVSAASST